ncbi:hypothetical protein ANN_01112 [Periplaneta americana]|uniref:Uncharacterized protein n=1 Tax=Periplaneta americana TaxID=6978 RepID=A0ABQ8TTS3_PERAM|nr:hypothetical protein ANN_01112 [Periplaneta americana]
MSPGSSTESYPAFAHIGLRENPGKNLNQVTCPNRESHPGHLVSRPDALAVTPQLTNFMPRRAEGILWRQHKRQQPRVHAGAVRDLAGETKKDTQLKSYTVIAVPTLLYGSENNRYPRRIRKDEMRLPGAHYPNDTIPGRWTGRGGEEDCVHCVWPPRSPILTPVIFICGVFVPHLPATLQDLRHRIVGTVNSIIRDQLILVWQEMDYRFDVCRATQERLID